MVRFSARDLVAPWDLSPLYPVFSRAALCGHIAYSAGAILSIHAFSFTSTAPFCLSTVPFIAYPPHGLNVFTPCAFPQLCPDFPDMFFYHITVSIRIVPPQRLVNVLPVKHLARIGHQKLNQVKFLFEKRISSPCQDTVRRDRSTISSPEVSTEERQRFLSSRRRCAATLADSSLRLKGFVI